jgi:hypothetical protein
MPLIMFVSSSFNTYVNLPKKKKGHDDRYLEAKKMEDDIDSMRQQISGADQRRFTMSKE